MIVGTALTVTGSLINSGTVTVGNALTVTGGYTQTGGSTNLSNEATLFAPAGVNIAGGSLSGSGTIHADVTNSGVVNPGGAGTAGRLSIIGAYTQTASGVLNVEISGTNPGTDFDQLVVQTGTTTLGGTLNVSLINGFMPPSGFMFQILRFDSSDGTRFDATMIDPSFHHRPAYDPMDVTITAKRRDSVDAASAGPNPHRDVAGQWLSPRSDTQPGFYESLPARLSRQVAVEQTMLTVEWFDAKSRAD